MNLLVAFVDDDGIDLFESYGVLFDDYFDMIFIADFDLDSEEDI